MTISVLELILNERVKAGYTIQQAKLMEVKKIYEHEGMDDKVKLLDLASVLSVQFVETVDGARVGKLAYK